MSFEAQAKKSEDQQIRGCLVGDDRQTNPTATEQQRRPAPNTRPWERPG